LGLQPLKVSLLPSIGQFWTFLIKPRFMMLWFTIP
jgi:hypothetical protein